MMNHVESVEPAFFGESPARTQMIRQLFPTVSTPCSLWDTMIERASSLSEIAGEQNGEMRAMATRHTLGQKNKGLLQVEASCCFSVPRKVGLAMLAMALLNV